MTNINQSPPDDAATTAVFYARRLRRALEAVPLQQQALHDMQDFIDVMIAQIRGEL